MSASIEERNRILMLVEAGQVSALQAAQLLDALGPLREPQVVERPGRQARAVHVRVTNLALKRPKVSVTIPIDLIEVGLRLATRLAPQISGSALERLLRAVQNGSVGRLLDLQDLEENERVEIFIE